MVVETVRQLFTNAMASEGASADMTEVVNR
jgi:hypothetical protein